ncbi:MAG TPA: cupredoxin domain-containing protein [Dehalococcoidia bacterium]
MNTGKQINVMVALVFLLVVLTGAYAVVDPIRAERQEEFQLDQSIERGSKLFANNCRSCHGNSGRGVLEGPQFPGAPLNNEDLRDPNRLEETQDRLFQTIACGRYATLMPPWSQEHGGPLNDEQIRQLVLLITQGDEEDWQHVEELSRQLNEEFGEVPAPDPSNPDNYTKGTCGSPNSLPASLVRSLQTAQPGQTPAATQTPTPVEAKTQWDVVAHDNFFDVETIAVPAGQSVTVRLQNQGREQHNISFYTQSPQQGGQTIQQGSVVAGGQQATVTFTAPAQPGSYFFRCDIHPNDMTGTLQVVG